MDKSWFYRNLSIFLSFLGHNHIQKECLQSIMKYNEKLII